MGQKNEVVSLHKYPGIWLDSSLTFTNRQNKVKSRLSFLFLNRSMFTTSAKKYFIETTVLPLFDYGDVIYINARKGVLEQLDILYHAAIRLITNAPYRTHHCELYYNYTFELDIIAYKKGNSQIFHCCL